MIIARFTLDERICGNQHIVANRQMADDRYRSADATIPANFCAAGDSGAPRYRGIRADKNIVGYLNLIV